jgi:hypothetical protein
LSRKAYNGFRYTDMSTSRSKACYAAKIAGSYLGSGITIQGKANLMARDKTA